MQKTIYIIQITKCSNKLYWYKDIVGNQLECELKDNQSLFWPGAQIYKTIDAVKIKGIDDQKNYLVVDDCKVITTHKK